MPTIHFEYTQNLNINNALKPFLTTIHHEIVAHIKTDIKTCRSLITCFDDYVVANGDANNAFIQLSIHILPGRSADLKKSLGEKLLQMINHTFASDIQRLNTEVRVLVQETDAEYYFGLG